MIQIDHAYAAIPFETAIDGEPAAADPLPTAILYRNGSASGVTVTVATTAVVGLYHASFTTGSDWAKTDRLYLQVTATLGAITDRRVVWDSFAEPDAVMRGTDGANTVVPPTVAAFEARTLPSEEYVTNEQLANLESARLPRLS